MTEYADYIVQLLPSTGESSPDPVPSPAFGPRFHWAAGQYEMGNLPRHVRPMAFNRAADANPSVLVRRPIDNPAAIGGWAWHWWLPEAAPAAADA